MINKFISELANRLKQPLPGADAQRMMMPLDSKADRFDLNRKNARLGGVMILLYNKEGSLYLPLTQRHNYGGTHGGQVSFPGGKWEEGDPSIQYTALRETNEEIGIDHKKIKVLGKLTDLYIPPSNFRVSPFVGYIHDTPNFNIDPFEVESLIETPLSLLIKDSTIKRRNITVSGNYNLNVPFFDIENRVVWGATAMMLAEFVAIARELEYNL